MAPLSLSIPAPAHQNSTIELIADNSQIMYMIDTGRSSNKCFMGWLREIILICFICNGNVFASYVRSENSIWRMLSLVVIVRK